MSEETPPPPPPPKRRSAREYLGDLALMLRLPTIASLVFTWLGFLSNAGLLTELTSHFRVQYLVLQAVFLVVLLATLSQKEQLLKRSGEVAIVAVSLLANAWFVGQLFLPQSQPEAGPERLKLLQININSRNRNTDLVTGCALDSKADFVSFEEVDEFWAKTLTEKLSADYPYQFVKPRVDNFGMAVFSKLPLEDPRLAVYGDAATPSIVAPVTFAGKKLTVVATHVLPPISDDYFKMRNQQFASMAKAIKQLGENVILAGDLNCTSWSAYFTDLTSAAGLRDSRPGFGVQQSWPTQIWPLQIPIDHFLVSPNFVVIDRKVLGKIGSDHLPVEVVVGWAK